MAHWLLITNDVRRLLQISQNRLEKLYPHLVTIMTPGQTRRFPDLFIEGLLLFLDGREATPELIRAFATSQHAQQLGDRARQKFQANVEHLSKARMLTTNDIAMILNVKKMTVSDWRRTRKLEFQNVNGMNLHPVEDFLNACSWLGPGRW